MAKKSKIASSIGIKLPVVVSITGKELCVTTTTTTYTQTRSLTTKVPTPARNVSVRPSTNVSTEPTVSPTINKAQITRCPT